MTGPLLITTTAIMLSVAVALLALSLGIADWWERRRCTCLFEPQQAVDVVMDADGRLWRVYPRCRVHGRQQRTRIYETANGELAVR